MQHTYKVHTNNETTRERATVQHMQCMSMGWSMRHVHVMSTSMSSPVLTCPILLGLQQNPRAGHLLVSVLVEREGGGGKGREREDSSEGGDPHG